MSRASRPSVSKKVQGAAHAEDRGRSVNRGPHTVLVASPASAFRSEKSGRSSVRSKGTMRPPRMHQRCLRHLDVDRQSPEGVSPLERQFTPLDQYFMKDPLTFPQIPPQSANCSPSSARVHIRGGERSSRRLHLHATITAACRRTSSAAIQLTFALMPPASARSAWRRSPPQRPAVHRSQPASARAPNRPGARSETPGNASRSSRARCRRW